jgi:muconolactone delta-isomerase
VNLVITHDKPHVNWKEQVQLLRQEAKVLWDLQKNGIIRNIWFTKNSREAILIIEAKDSKSVKEIIDTFPLVKECLITYDIVELVAYDGYERLFI